MSDDNNKEAWAQQRKKAAEGRQRESEVALLAEELFVMKHLSPRDAFDAAELFMELKEERWQALLNPPKPVSE